MPLQTHAGTVVELSTLLCISFQKQKSVKFWADILGAYKASNSTEVI